VQKKDYDDLGQAMINSLEQALGDKFTFEMRRAWSIVYRILKDSIISNNYEEMENIRYLYNKYEMAPEEIEEVVKLWRKAVSKGQDQLG
jgi:hemoglobin-like flavoprotein